MSSVLASLPHRKFTVEDYHRFIEMGIFKPEERLELWEGELVEMSPIGKRHAGVV
jgi:Uma2 family endonuclease